MRRVFCVLPGILVVSVLFAHEMVRDKASVDLGSGKVMIDYGTPKLKGRNLDEMIQPGRPWRMGMDDPTTLETTVALDFGNNKKLAPGKYTLFARADENKNWTLLVSNTTTGRPDPATVVVETPLHFMKEDQPVEVLKITLQKAGNSVSLLVAWGTYRLHGSFKAA
jgi:hypothetical protein